MNDRKREKRPEKPDEIPVVAEAPRGWVSCTETPEGLVYTSPDGEQCLVPRKPEHEGGEQ